MPAIGKSWIRKKLTAQWSSAPDWAPVLAMGLFLIFVGGAMVMKNVAPQKAILEESPMASAQSLAAGKIFKNIYLAECEAAALERIEPTYRKLAQLGLLRPESFPEALECLNDKLQDAGLPTLEDQLRQTPHQEWLDASCVGKLKSSGLCQRGFDLAKTQAAKVAQESIQALARSTTAQKNNLRMPKN